MPKKDVSVGKIENIKTGGDRIRLFIYSFLMFIGILLVGFVALNRSLFLPSVNWVFILIFLGVGVLIFIWGWKGKKKIKEKINYTIEHKRE